MSNPETVEIREAVPTDLPTIVRMLADDVLGSNRESYCEPLPREYHTAFEEISESDDNILLVAVFDKMVVGVLQVTFVPYLTFRGGKRALVEGVRVEKAFRSKGIGRLLLEEVVRRSKERGCHLIQLTTDKSRREARKFYESCGFVASHEGLKLFL
ncbi:MAG: GNAT family N-acetyltransferase [Verrucomicrobiales bacterium]|nr:GNAT family N-acetyltransferase [Verrucomicrobiales bacterium]